MDPKAKKCLRRYLTTKFNSIIADFRIRRISQVLAHRSALEVPMGSFVGKTREKLMELAQKTGNPDFFMAYLQAGLRSEKRSLFEGDENLCKEFIKEAEKLLASIKTMNSSGQVVKPEKFDEAVIASLIENAFIAARNIVLGLPIEGGHPPDGMEDVDGVGSWGPATKT